MLYISFNRDGSVGVLMKVLATEPGEYSYFDTNLMRMWAGPSHWKLRVNIKGENENFNSEYCKLNSIHAVQIRKVF